MEQSDNSTVLEVFQLAKVFRDFWRRPCVTAVDGLDLSVQRGEIIGLLGPNGSGKSTTIKMLLGLLHPTEGSIRILGGRPADVAVRKRIGYLPENSYLYRYLTPRETLMFYGRLFDLSAPERRRRTAELIEMTGLGPAADRAVGEFSKGMARRLGLAQALLNAPDLLILDEPTSGLDPMGCRQVKELLQALAEGGTTILLTSHLLADVEHVCDRVVIMYDGRPRAAGTLKSLLESHERMTVNVPTLDAAATRRLLELLRQELDCDAEVSRPSMNLEEFFVSVVKEARETGASDDVGDSKIAAFLQK
ncbi:MAG: ABC transporter ATP-binding protein [Kiritimatiellae bacterium]|nr:ABC transporter ATP-binding protein [Kiritimatiellia bacterium]